MSVLIAPGLFYRHLSIAEVHLRQRARHERERHVHNAHCIETAEATEPVRSQVLGEFPAATRRMVRR